MIGLIASALAPMPFTTTEFEQICLLYLSGRPVRSLSRQFKVARSTLHKALVRRLGKQGSQRNRTGNVALQKEFLALYPEGSQYQLNTGCIAIVEEHLKSKRLSRNQKNVVRRWMATNLQTILEIDAKHATPLLTAHQEDRLSWDETSRYQDFRSDFEEGSYVA